MKYRPQLQAQRRSERFYSSSTTGFFKVKIQPAHFYTLIVGTLSRAVEKEKKIIFLQGGIGRREEAAAYFFNNNAIKWRQTHKLVYL